MTQPLIPQLHEFQTNNFLHFIGSKKIKVNRRSFNKKHLLPRNINNKQIPSSPTTIKHISAQCVFFGWLPFKGTDVTLGYDPTEIIRVQFDD